MYRVEYARLKICPYSLIGRIDNMNLSVVSFYHFYSIFSWEYIYIYIYIYRSKQLLTQSARTVEYADCIFREGKIPTQTSVLIYNTKHWMVRLHFRSFITIIPRSTVTRTGSTSLGPIYGSNRNIYSFSKPRNIYLWASKLLNLNWMISIT